MEIKELTELTRNTHFLRFVAFLGVPQQALWRKKHPEVPSVRGTLNRLMKLSKSLDQQTIQVTFATELLGLLIAITEADSYLSYSVEDMEWIVECLDHPDASYIFPLLFAYASCPIRWYTAQQIQQFTDKAPSTLRNYTAQGQIIGARKIGKTWLYPDSSLAVCGIVIPDLEKREEDEDDTTEVEEE